MVDLAVNKFLWSFSLVSYFLRFFHVFRKTISMALGFKSPTSSPSSSSWISFMLDNSQFPKTLAQGLPILNFEQESPKEQVREESPEKSSTKGLRTTSKMEIGKAKVSSKIRKRPTRLLVPESVLGLEFGEKVQEESQEFEVAGKYFSIASRKGKKNVMEDGYEVITDITGDSAQAFFGVFDGHGGLAAVNFVAEHLGKNIVKSLNKISENEAIEQSKAAIREGYLVTDKEFLTLNVPSGVCAATVLVKEGGLYVANVGDCRVVLSRNGVATALTSDHRLDREDERLRIELQGGYVSNQNGVWRVQGSLAVSRAIGDLYLKQWVISEPEIKKLELTSDCEFLVIASDGLWDKVSNQEAVDMVLRNENSTESCKKLVDISSSRGNRDDITVMVIDLQNFK